MTRRDMPNYPHTLRSAGAPMLAISLALTTACPADDDGDTTGADASTGSPATGSTTDPSTGEPPGESSSDGTGPASTGEEETTDSSGEPPSTSTGAAGLEIAGVWLEDVGAAAPVTHTVDELNWSSAGPFGDSLYHVTSFDNEARAMIAQGDATNEFFPELYNKFNWHWDGDELYYCTAVFDAATPEDAMAAPDADPGDLQMGCGGFPWSNLTMQL